MTGELTPGPDIRVSDAERNRVVELLNQAVGDGRLTLAEFEDRIGGVLAARTHGELTPFTADLATTGTPEVLEMRTRASSLKRVGRWAVPRRLVIEARSSNVHLDFTEATTASQTVEILLDTRSSSVTLVLPPGGSASLHEIELSASTAKASVPESGGLHIVVRGKARSSSVKARYQRRFLRWRW